MSTPLGFPPFIQMETTFVITCLLSWKTLLPKIGNVLKERKK